VPGGKGDNAGKGSKNCSVSMEFSRGMTKDLVDRTMTSVEKAMEEARLTPDSIDRVLLVGGMTRMPVIASRLEAIFGSARLPVVDPDKSVVNGAAIQGGIISGENCDQILVDVTPHTLSLASLSTTVWPPELQCEKHSNSHHASQDVLYAPLSSKRG